jgi:DNA-binding transcriptional MerR regulator
MTHDTAGGEKAYWARDVAKLLGISDSTLRKYCLILEQNGYKFLRDDHGRRAYVDYDVTMFRKFIEFSKNPNLTLEDAAIAIVSKFNRDDVTAITLSATHETDRYNERYDELMSKIESLVEHNKKQEALYQTLIERMEDRFEKQERYIEESLRKRDEHLVTALREIQEVRKLQAAAEEQNQKKKWWEFWK